MILRLGAAQLFYLDTPAYAAVDSSVRLADASNGDARLQGADQRGAAPAGRDGRRRPTIRPSFAPPLAVRPLARRVWRGRRARHRRRRSPPSRPPTSRRAIRPTPPRSPRRWRPSRCPAARCDAPVAGGSRNGRASPRAAGGCRTPPPPSPRGCWRRRPARPSLDLCAAPGGKTLQLAAAGATVTALDRSAARLRRLADGLARTGLTAEIVAADAETWGDPRQLRRRAARRALHRDRHLPPQSRTCSGRCGPRDIAKLAEVQSRLLDAAAAPREAGRPAGLLRLLAGAGGGRGAGRAPS